jgi:hypothetical protein
MEVLLFFLVYCHGHWHWGMSFLFQDLIDRGVYTDRILCFYLKTLLLVQLDICKSSLSSLFLIFIAKNMRLIFP